MACPEHDKLRIDIATAMVREDMARQSSPKQYPYNSLKKRQEAIEGARGAVHRAYQRRNSHILTCEACKTDGQQLEQYDSFGHC
jgi:hypothetical protein